MIPPSSSSSSEYLGFMSAAAWKPDAVGPGHSAVTVTPVPRVSSVSASENESTYALVA